jgi:uncharacterized membrane protein
MVLSRVSPHSDDTSSESSLSATMNSTSKDKNSSPSQRLCTNPVILFLCSLILLITSNGCVHPDAAETKPLGEELIPKQERSMASSRPVNFATHVKPILENRCVMCHNRITMKGYMNLDDRREAVKSGALGKYIIPGYPEISLLLTNMRSHKNTSVMPVVGVRATADECEIIAKWIKEGAHWPTSAEGTLDTQQ